MELEEREKMEKKRGRAPKSGTPKVEISWFVAPFMGRNILQLLITMESNVWRSYLKCFALHPKIFLHYRVKSGRQMPHQKVAVAWRRRQNERLTFSTIYCRYTVFIREYILLWEQASLNVTVKLWKRIGDRHLKKLKYLNMNTFSVFTLLDTVYFRECQNYENET